jgi:hypothetical protein
VGLDDYAQALGAAQRLVPNWRQGDFQEAQLAQERLQPQLMQAQIAGQQAQAQAVALKQDRQAAFQARLQALGAKPSPQAYRALGAEYPEFHDALDGVATGLDGEQSKSLVRRLAPIQAQIANKQYDAAAAEVKRHLDADKAAGLPEDEDDKHLYDELTSGDTARQQAAGGIVYGILASLDPKNAAVNATKVAADRNHVVSAGGALVDETGKVLFQADAAPQYRSVKNADGSESIVQVGGGDPVSSGGAAGRGSDVSRLINSDAGGGQVPSSVQTLGQFVSWGRAMNRKGAKSSSAGTYQINGTTMAEFAPQALGSDWQSARFNANAQEKVGKAIFDWAKQQPNPAAALKGRWVSLSGQQAAKLVKGDWSQARGTIAQGETGGGPSASASRGTIPASGRANGAQVVFTSEASSGGSQFRLLSADEKRAQGLDVGSQFQVSPEGKITPLGRKTELTEGERKATGLLASMVAASNSLNSVRGYQPSEVALGLNSLANGNPIKRNLSQTDRRVLNGQLAFANSILRLESGAAIGAQETANKALTLFPMPGDGPEVQADKRAQREAALQSMRTSAGAGAVTVNRVGVNKSGQQPQRVAAPHGGKLIGMYQGKQVFRLANGKRVVAR